MSGSLRTSKRVEALVAASRHLDEHKDRRSVYRVKPQAQDLPTVRLQRGQVAFPVLVLDISSAGAGLVVLPDAVPALRRAVEHQRLAGWRLHIAPPGRIPTVLPATSVWARPLESGVRMAIQFTVTPEQRVGLDARLLALFNQRRAVRVALAGGEPIVATLRRPGGATLGPGVLRDVSMTGLGLVTAGRLQQELEGRALLAVRMMLPNERASVEVVGACVRVRRLETPPELGIADVCEVGVSVDANDAAGARASLVLGRFVVAQQVTTRGVL